MKPFTVYIVQFAHTDIGYTHPRAQIERMYLEHYDRVLALCAQTQHAPEDSRFKWTCETAWQVRHYLHHRPERTAEFVECVRRGQIEITASDLHFTDLIDSDALERSLTWAVSFCREHGLPLKTAMQCDINGWPWSLADALEAHQIPYFLSHVHLDSATDPLGRRGSVHYGWLIEAGIRELLRPDAPVRIPRGFRWVGPKGGSVLHWLGDHYLMGNMLGLASHQPFGADKTRYFLETDRLNVSDLLARARERLPAFVERMRTDGYPFDAMLVTTGGYYIDNAPPDARGLALIERWNAERDDIHLRTATVSEWFAVLEQTGTVWPEHQVAWPDHWAHGLGSSTARVAQARRTQRRRAAVLSLVKASGLSSALNDAETALDAERFALEHTFGAWSTTVRPRSGLVDFQQSAKELEFHRAELHLDEAAGAALRALVPADPAATRLYAQMDAGDQARVVHFDAGDLMLKADTQTLRGEDGRAMRFQDDQPELRQFVAVVSAPGAGLHGFEPHGLEPHSLEPHSLEPATAARSALGAPLPNNASSARHTGRTGNAITGLGWHVEVDPRSGGLSKLVDARSGRDWVDLNAGHPFGGFVHETVVHPLGRQATHNLARFVALDVASPAARAELGDATVFERRTPTFAADPLIVRGPVFDAVKLVADVAEYGALQVQWRVYHGVGIAELVVDWDKHWSERPEAAYIAFGFAAPGARLRLETAGGFFEPGSHAAGGQLAGTCSSYYTVQRAAQITGADGAELLWLPVDAPLVMTNAVNFNRWETDPYRWNGLLASMPVNQYWHTNFAASQRGALRLRYRFVAPDASGLEAAIRMAQPLEAVGWR
jgi:hypothetical protein